MYFSYVCIITYLLVFCFSYPDIVYLLHITSFATLDEVKNYRVTSISRVDGCLTSSGRGNYQDENVVLILGKVRHSYAASKAPLQPWVLVDSNGTVMVAHCTCMAELAERLVLMWAQYSTGLKQLLEFKMPLRVPQRRTSG